MLASTTRDFLLAIIKRVEEGIIYNLLLFNVGVPVTLKIISCKGGIDFPVGENSSRS